MYVIHVPGPGCYKNLWVFCTKFYLLIYLFYPSFWLYSYYLSIGTQVGPNKDGNMVTSGFYIKNYKNVPLSPGDPVFTDTNPLSTQEDSLTKGRRSPFKHLERPLPVSEKKDPSRSGKRENTRVVDLQPRKLRRLQGVHLQKRHTTVL